MRKKDNKERKSPQGKPYSEVEHIVNSREQYLFSKEWKPDGNPSALLFICHGVAEHCLRYDDIAKRYNDLGILVFAHDHIGHGQSEGDRVHLTDFMHYVEDVIQHVTEKQKLYPDIPVFIYGHSMGGAITIRAMMEKPTLFRGAVLSGPAVIPSPETATTTRVFIARILGRIYPQCPIGKLDDSFICRDKEVIKSYQNDPLVYHGYMKAKWGLCTLSCLQYIQAHLNTIEWPFLILHGDEDKLCSLEGSQVLYDRAASTDKTIKVYKGAYHQLHHEPEGVGEQSVDEMVNWVKERM
ncbi:monoglyceride lipase-like isoform X1 [Lineus longissimus]|uniref:monoglyceride lipase-like isoform X1 n=1 Tax=Lineus longissimus TaxID=88925 RepID=UPI002B4D2CFA